MSKITTNQYLHHMLTTGQFSTLELLWIRDTNAQKQKTIVRNKIQSLMHQQKINKTFHPIIRKTLYHATTPLLPANPKPSKTAIIFKGTTRPELIDFIRSIYRTFGCLPDETMITEVFYYGRKQTNGE